MKGGSLHTRSFRRMHFSFFRCRWSKNGFTGPKSFRGFRVRRLHYSWSATGLIRTQHPRPSLSSSSVVFVLWQKVEKTFRKVLHKALIENGCLWGLKQEGKNLLGRLSSWLPVKPILSPLDLKLVSGIVLLPLILYGLHVGICSPKG